MISDIHPREGAILSAQREDYAWLTLIHDIRNLLIGIDRVLQVTLNESVRLAPRSRRLLSDTNNNCELMIDMLDDVMDAYRMQKQSVSSSENPIHISQVIQVAIRLLAFLAEEKEITFQTQVPRQAVVPPLDKHRIMRVMVNLLHNAIKFSPVGQTVYIDAEIRGDKAVLIRITDSGPGLSSNGSASVRPRSNGAPGCSWGLYYCQTALAHMGGKLWVEAQRTRNGKGTTISFTLPLARTQ
jgi:signal transduction histidine kinase